jgi:hypothetical protein
MCEQYTYDFSLLNKEHAKNLFFHVNYLKFFNLAPMTWFNKVQHIFIIVKDVEKRIVV